MQTTDTSNCFAFNTHTTTH